VTINELLVYLYINQDKTAMEISAITGISENTIRYRLSNRVHKIKYRPKEHGTANYSRGCRCEICIKTKTARQKRFRKEASERFRTDPSYVEKIGHGLGTYINYGCRCDICSEAKRVQNAKYYKTRQQRKPRHKFYGASKQPSGRYRSRMVHKGQWINIGVFDTAREAAMAYDAKRVELGLSPRNNLS
jgi:hypothetical protein